MDTPDSLNFNTTDFWEQMDSLWTIRENTPKDQVIHNLVSSGVSFCLQIVAAIAVYLIGALLIKWIRAILRRTFEKRKSDKAVASFTLSLVTTMMWIIVIILSVGLLGIETTSLAACLAAGGMAIGMALSGTVQNFAGGIMILAFKPFKVGDFINAQGYEGKVEEMNLTSTKIRTVDNKIVILPNGELSNNAIKNFTREPVRRVDIPVSVEYGTDADKVRRIILDIVSKDKYVLSVKDGALAEPFVGLQELGSSSVDFKLKVWVKTADYWDAYYSLNEKIYTTLPANGIAFPFPQLTIHQGK